MTRLGILGGSFDPPHVGHVVLAQDARDALALDQLLVIPTATQPLKRQHASSAEQRVAMTRLAFHGVAGVSVDTTEVDRGGLSYTVDTVRHLRGRHPLATVSLLVGDDALASLDRWHEVDALLRLVELVVLGRAAEGHVSVLPGASRPDADAGESRRVEHAAHVVRTVHTVRGIGAVPVRRLQSRRIDISSTEIRARVRAGQGITGFVSDAVAQYIVNSRLYLPEYAAS